MGASESDDGGGKRIVWNSHSRKFHWINAVRLVSIIIFVPTKWHVHGSYSVECVCVCVERAGGFMCSSHLCTNNTVAHIASPEHWSAGIGLVAASFALLSIQLIILPVQVVKLHHKHQFG